MHVTHNTGVQITENIAREGFVATYGSALGKDWSKSAWTITADETHEPYISEIYKSVATNKFCLTVSAPIFAYRDFMGVVGVDFNVSRMIEDFS